MVVVLRSVLFLPSRLFHLRLGAADEPRDAGIRLIDREFV